MTGILCAIAGMSGGASVTFPLPDPTSVSETDTAPVEVGYALKTSGDVITIINGSETVIGDWIVPSTTHADYEVYATLTSGTLTTGTTGSWLSLGTQRTWGTSVFSPGTNQSAEIFIEIRLIAGPGPVVADATISLFAEYL